ncbi:variable charge X-linked protein 3B [Anopheles bellator]|uniref:variable charge X-linked protein 3B n=1 Tax=Anopheles bellator TaxID=139047 RepID=UPI00264791A8|nr:variable charge X-linked protein 3B [Anopheles bellator]
MVDVLETDPEIARALKKEDQSALWDNLTKELNALGPPIETPATWKKVWSDYKCAVKKKLRWNRAALIATGGGPNITKPLSELEERVVNLTKLQCIIIGNQVENFGYNQRSNVEPMKEPIEEPNQQAATHQLPIEEVSNVRADDPLPRKNKAVNVREKVQRLEEVLRQNQELIEIMKLKIESDEKIIKSQEAMVAEFRQNQEQTRKLNESMEKNIKSQEAMVAEFRQNQEQTSKLNESMEKIIKSQEVLSNKFDSYIEALTAPSSWDQGGSDNLELTRAQIKARKAGPKDLPIFKGDPEEWPTYLSM